VYVRGSNQGIEFNRDDQSFYKGIIVKNNDPEMLFRCKVYLPEISNQPLDDWLKAFANGTIKTKFPGTNNPTDNWSDVQIFHEISQFIPWAESCIPIVGETGPARFFSPDSVATVSETNAEEGFETNNTSAPTIQTGSFAPAHSYVNDETNLPDAFADPTKNQTIYNNPYSREYQPAGYSEASKGTFCIPRVGAQVWVFHYRGDLNFPVYFGARNSTRDNATVYASAQGAQGSSAPPSDSYPGAFENHPQQDTPPETVENEIPPGARPPRPLGEVSEQAGRAELANLSPETRERLYKLTQAEVGGQGPLAQQAFMETVANRAAVQGVSIDEIVSDGRYYEPINTKGAGSVDNLRPVSNSTAAEYNNILGMVAGGSNITNGATQNASGAVARNWQTLYDGQPGTRVDIGGETFYSKTYEQSSLTNLDL
jgi:hypothetical protein